MRTEDYNDDNLEKLIKALKPQTLPVGKIGVLGKKNQRSGEGESTNAEIGAKHELGLDGMPKRSWLRVPLIDNLEKYLKEAGAFSPQVVKQIIKLGSFKPFMEKAMIVCERIVADGFNSGGFGKWKPSDMTKKKVHLTLVETQQLRNSVTSEVQNG